MGKLRETFLYWIMVLRQGLAAAWRTVGLSASTEGIRNISLAVLGVALVWGLGSRVTLLGLRSQDRFSEAIDTIVIALIFFACIYAAAFFCQMLYLPASIWRTAQDEIRTLKERLEPRLSVSVPPELTPIEFGKSSLTLGGTVHTALMSREATVRLLVKNDSATTLEACEARLLSASKLTDGEFRDLGMIEDVSLPWERDHKTKPFSVRIDPDQTKCIYVGAVRQQGNIVLWRELNELPTEYVHLFRDAGIYRLLIQIKGADRGPMKVLLEIASAQVQPEPNRLPLSKADIRIISTSEPSHAGDLGRKHERAACPRRPTDGARH